MLISCNRRSCCSLIAAAVATGGLAIPVHAQQCAFFSGNAFIDQRQPCPGCPTFNWLIGNDGFGSVSLTNGCQDSIWPGQAIYMGVFWNGGGTLGIEDGSILDTPIIYVGHFGFGDLTVNGVLNVSRFSCLGHEWGGFPSNGPIGYATVSGPNAVWNTGSLYVGHGHFGGVCQGDLLIEDGGTVNSVNAWIGRLADGTGSVTVDNGEWTLERWPLGELDVGSEGDGELIITNGGEVSGGPAWIGRMEGSTGSVTVDNGLWNTQGLVVGSEGEGEMLITNGGRVNGGAIWIGRLEGGTGVVTIDNSRLSMDYVDVGSAGDGELRFTNGGWAFSDSIVVGRDPGSRGIVVVDGVGSRIAVGLGSEFAVGFEGDGTMQVTNGALASSGAGLRVGAMSGSVGTILVSGTGSNIELGAGNLIVGDQSLGTFTIEDGAWVRISESVFISKREGSDGQVVVTGPNSFLSVAGGLFVGNVDPTTQSDVGGVLRVAADGWVDVFSTLRVNNLSTMAFEVTRRNDELINAGRNVELGGTLAVTLHPSLVPIPGEEFELISVLFGGQTTGTFVNYGEGDIVANRGGVDLHITYAGGQASRSVVLYAEAACYADCDQSGTLDIFDFLCFQNSFVSGEPYACDCDPDPACDIFDFLCFQTAFVGGCP